MLSALRNGPWSQGAYKPGTQLEARCNILLYDSVVSSEQRLCTLQENWRAEGGRRGKACQSADHSSNLEGRMRVFQEDKEVIGISGKQGGFQEGPEKGNDVVAEWA